MKRTSFVTFYSYKGGVGRTSALVNSAIMRANKGHKVVIIDFDLEAPGVGSYLHSLDKRYSENRRGILEYITTYRRENRILSLKNDLAFNFSNVIRGENGGELWVINAGDVEDKDYAKNLDDISWVNIFKDNDGDLFLKNMKKQIEAEFDPDFVFIDSRTGITETGGVCTKYLADTVVILTSLNKQNIKGTSSIYKDLKESSRLGGGTKDFIFVASNVPVGMPAGKGNLLEERFDAFRDAFNNNPDVVIYNYPSLSLSEEMPVLMSSKSDNEDDFLMKNDPIHQSYSMLSRKIRVVTKNKFFKYVTDACEDLFFRKNIQSENYQTLVELYPDRLFTEIVKGFYKYQEIFKSDVIKWNEIDLGEFDTFVKKAKGSTNNIIRRHFHTFCLLSSREIYEKEERIDDRIKDFIKDDNILLMAALREMSFGNYLWPRNFFEQEYKQEPEQILYLFNLAMCKYRLGEDSKSDFRVVIEKMYPLEAMKNLKTRANYISSIGFAYEILGDSKKSLEMYNKALSDLANLNVQDEVYSPFTYKDTKKEEFKIEIENRIQKIKG